MGDNWRHRIIIERKEVAEDGILYPAFLDGDHRCPSKDCGSVPGYYKFLNAISGPDKGSREKQETLAWYSQPYVPDSSDKEHIRITLNRIANTGRPGKRASSTT